MALFPLPAEQADETSVTSPSAALTDGKADEQRKFIFHILDGYRLDGMLKIEDIRRPVWKALPDISVDQAAFDRADANNDGRLSGNEFGVFLSANPQVRAIFQGIFYQTIATFASKGGIKKKGSDE